MTSSWKAVRSLDKAYKEYGNLLGDPRERTAEALAEDPTCVLAHCLRGLLAAIGKCDAATVAKSLGAAEEELLARGALATGGGDEDESPGGGGSRWRREKAFAAALRSWSGGRWREGALVLESWLMESPVDFPALKLVQDAHLSLGDSANVRDCVGRVMPFWREGVFGYGNVLGMYAFGLAENGAYAVAEEHAHLALAREPEDVSAMRAMSEVYELEARASEGCSFLSDLRDTWEDREGPLRTHLGWHLGVFSLERGQEAQALRVFDTVLSPPKETGSLDGKLRLPPPPPSALADACSLLWRMDIFGLQAGPERWRDVAEAWYEHHHLRHACTLHDVHALMAFTAMMAIEQDGAVSNREVVGQQAASAWRERAEDLIDSMRGYVKRRAGDGDGGGVSLGMERYPRDGTPSRVVEFHSFSPGRGQGSLGVPARLEVSESPTWMSSEGGVEGQGRGVPVDAPPDNLWVAEHLGLPLCEAILAYKEGHFERTVYTLLPLRYHFSAIGGSHAQRDIVNLTLIDAATRLPDVAVARALINERRMQRPGSGRTWQAYASLMERGGDQRASFEARRMAFELGIGQGGTGAH